MVGESRAAIPYRIYTVSEITTYIKNLLETDRLLTSLWVCGEISNFKHHLTSGHMYFTLKDGSYLLNCVMFKYKNRNLNFTPENGMKVIARGYIGLYGARSQYQLYVDILQPEGYGTLYLAFEKLKKELEQEGLFRADHKKPIPRFPRRIGVVTSESAAALRDILNVIGRRYPGMDIVISPCAVQGEGASSTIVSALERLNEYGDVDTVIVARGGGSIEELWPFNEENVARAIFESRLPVISGVGHETDFTIADFVADLRAPTPSAAAELAVPDRRVIMRDLTGLKERLFSAVTEGVARKRELLHRYDFSSLKTRLIRYFDRYREKIAESQRMITICLREKLSLEYHRLKSAGERIRSVFQRRLSMKVQQLQLLSARLAAVNPHNILRRGYSLCVSPRDGKLVKFVEQVEKGDMLDVRMNDGTLNCEVKDIKKVTPGLQSKISRKTESE